MIGAVDSKCRVERGCPLICLFIVEKEVIVDDKISGLPCAPYNNAFSANEYADHVKIIFTYETITIPTTLVEVSYQINIMERFL